jgi:O-antigen ligase
MLRLDPGSLGALLFLGVVALLVVALGLRSPLVACLYLLVTTLFRLAIPSGPLLVDPFLIAFVGALGSTWLWSRPWERRPAEVRVDAVTCAIGLYVGWNVLSMVLPHAYAAGAPLDPEPFSVPRFVLIGIVMPLSSFLIGRRVFVTEQALRILLWSLVASAAYSSVMSILPFIAPRFVWPTYVLASPTWPGRAVGVFNQPVVNGLVLIVGFLVATLIASHRAERPLLRVCAALIAAASVAGVYLTHTRVVWLSFALVVIIGVGVAKGFRAGFIVVGFGMVAAVVANWSTFTSADRRSGGVGSPDEIQDRLNTIATSIWAFEREPVTGWGIGRFAAVNTYHHQKWSPAIPWDRGFGIPSHLDGLGVLVELGLVGLFFWLAVQVLVYARLVQAILRLPASGMYGRALALTALLVLIAQSITGLTVDLRFFDFPNIIVLLLAGAATGWQRQQARDTAIRRAAMAMPPAPAPSRPVREIVSA